MADVVSIEAVKEQLRAVLGALTPLTPAAVALTATLELLDAMPDPAELAKLVGSTAEKRHAARRRAKLEIAHTLQRRREGVDAEHAAQDTTWRDGYARGLEHAHAHVMGMDPKDPD